MSRIAAGIAEQYPDIKKDWGATVDRWVDRIVGPQLRLSLIVLMAAVGAVLLIACANLANLLLARATLRSREISVRAALGASRWQLVRQLLTESLILSTLGGVAAVLVGFLLFRGILSQLPPFSLPPQAPSASTSGWPRSWPCSRSSRRSCSDLAPALQASRRDASLALKEGGRGGSASRRKAWLRNALVVSQVALAFVLVCGAGLLVRSFARLTQRRPRLRNHERRDDGLPAADGARHRRRAAHELRRPGDRSRCSAVPGVRQAAMTSALPLQGWGFGMPFRVSRTQRRALEAAGLLLQDRHAGLLRRARNEAPRGRGLSETDTKGSLPGRGRQRDVRESPVRRRRIPSASTS